MSNDILNFKSIIAFLHEWDLVLTHIIKDSLKSRPALEMEILALRSQLSLYQQQTLNHHKPPKPRPTPVFRQLWFFISKLWPDWKSALFVFLLQPKISIRKITTNLADFSCQSPTRYLGNGFPDGSHNIL